MAHARRMSLFVALLPMALTLSTQAQDAGTTIYSFAGLPDASTPITGLVADQAGNLYGTSTSGGEVGPCLDGCGTVYELSPAAGGGWTETILYRFTGSDDGGFPWSSLIFDSAGNLYGETSVFGPGNSQYGTVFKLSPNGNGTWSLTTLYAFNGGNDGSAPTGGLIFDAKGNLFGTTLHGGNQGVSACAFFSVDGCGTAFMLTPAKAGMWTETQLHAFTGGSDGGIPYAGLTFDTEGNLYGTAAVGGGSANCPHGCGIVFRLTALAKAGYRFAGIYRFDSANGAIPHGRLVFDPLGNLYGTTTSGGSVNAGSVFELSPRTQAPWGHTLLHAFTASTDGNNAGAGPEGPLLFDSAGNLYGTTPNGGGNFYGAAYELSYSAGWTLTTLYSFTADNANPNNGLVRDASGNLYCTTYNGGISPSTQWGTVVELSPSPDRRGK